MAVVTVLPDGRVIARAAITAKVIAATTDTDLGATTVAELRKIEYVLQFNLTTSPDTYAIPHDAKIDGNVIGVTVYTGLGTTVSGEVIAIGY